MAADVVGVADVYYCDGGREGLLFCGLYLRGERVAGDVGEVGDGCGCGCGHFAFGGG